MGTNDAEVVKAKLNAANKAVTGIGEDTKLEAPGWDASGGVLGW